MIKNQITLKQLETFVCVVDVGSFRRAADVLATTQPNVSSRVSVLEASLGVLLLHRDTGGLRLTEKGAELLAAARQVLWAGEAFLEAAGRRDLIVERLRLGVTEMVACTWLHAFLRDFREAYPSVSVELVIEMSVEVERQMAAGELDLVLQAGPFDLNVSDSMPLGSSGYCWVAAPGAITRGKSLEDVFQGPVLTHARHVVSSKELAKAARARGLPMERMVHSSSLTSCAQMAADGMGAALLPSPLVQKYVDAGQLEVLDIDWMPPRLEVFARFDRAKTARFVSEAAKIAAKSAAAYQENLSTLEET